MSPAPPRRRAADRIGLGLALLPACLIGWLVFRFMVDVPLVDDWRLAEDLADSQAGTWDLQKIFRFHNEHRIPASRVLMVLLAEATHWNTRWIAAVSLALSLATALLLLRHLRPALAPLPAVARAWTVVGASIALFSAAQFENWLWAFSFTGALAFLAATSALVLLRAPFSRSARSARSAGSARSAPAEPLEPRHVVGRVLVAIVLATIASWSQGAGVVVWPVGLILLLSGPTRANRRAAVAIWIAAALGIFALQLSGLQTDHDPLGFIRHPGRYLYFVGTLLGAPLTAFSGSAAPPRDGGLGFVAGLVGLVGAAMVLGQSVGRRRSLEPWQRLAAALILLSVGSAVVIALGRFTGGGPEAYASRYGLWSTPLWLGLGVHCARASCLSPDAVRRRLAMLGGLGLVAALSWSSASHVPRFRHRNEFLQKPVVALHWGEPDYYLVSINAALDRLQRRRPYLLERRLSALRTPRPARLALSLPLTEFRASVAASELPATLRARVPFELTVHVTNVSSVPWPSMGWDPAQGGAVRLASRWFRGGALVREGGRADLVDDLAPGSAATLRLCLEPPEAGEYQLEIGLVQENVAWFADHAAARERLAATVQPSTTRYLRRPLQRAWKDLTGRGCAP